MKYRQRLQSCWQKNSASALNRNRGANDHNGNRWSINSTHRRVVSRKRVYRALSHLERKKPFVYRFRWLHLFNRIVRAFYHRTRTASRKARQTWRGNLTGMSTSRFENSRQKYPRAKCILKETLGYVCRPIRFLRSSNNLLVRLSFHWNVRSPFVLL